MKKTVLGLALLTSVLAFSAHAENIGTVTQALGEQCAVITNLTEFTDPGASGGGCGSSSDRAYWEGNVKMSVTASLEGGKEYDVVIKVINDNDEVSEAYAERNIYFSRDQIYHADGLIYNLPRRGRFQVNLNVINANTGVTICSAQSLITSVK